MFKDIKELKEFIIWCKAQKLKSFQVDGLQFELSEITYAEEIPNNEKSNLGEYNTDTLTDTLESKDFREDPDLFWSSNP
jgi:hypothetical protein